MVRNEKVTPELTILLEPLQRLPYRRRFANRVLIEELARLTRLPRADSQTTKINASKTNCEEGSAYGGD